MLVYNDISDHEIIGIASANRKFIVSVFATAEKKKKKSLSSKLENDHSHPILRDFPDLVELNLNNNDIFVLWGDDFHTPRLKRLHLHGNHLQYLNRPMFRVNY